MSADVVRKGESKVFNKSNLRITLILFAITAITALLLSVVYALTKDTIAAQELAAAEFARMQALPGATAFTEETFIDESGVVSSAYAGEDASGKVIGHVFQTAAQGFGGKVKLMVGILNTDSGEKSVTKVVVLDVSSETPGLGTKVNDGAFLQRFSGIKSADISAVDGVTGATYSSNAVKAGIEAALAAEVEGAAE